jgi:predicted O-linked N-acetylglucosamine transferase (SPINDLY family)
MGLFDRFRTTAPSGTNGVKQDALEQNVTHLIEEGHVLEAEGKLDDAMQRYQKAIRLAPNPARAHLNRGNILLLQGDLQGALDAFSTAIKHQPDYAGAYYNIGNALLHDGKLDEAVANYRKALEIRPDYAEVHCSLGVALKEFDQLDGAIASLRKALQINPDLIEARTNLGNILQHLYKHGSLLLANRNFDAAVASFRRILMIEPELADGHYNLGHALKELGQLDAAAACFHKTLEIDPDHALAHLGLGLILHECGQFLDAVASYRQAIRIKPDFSGAYNNLGIALQGLGQLDAALESYRQALHIRPDFTEAFDNLLLILNFFSLLKPSYYLEQARQYGSIVSRQAERYKTWPCFNQPKRLRVGLVSGDFRKHSVGYFLEGLLAHIDPSRIELIAYPTHHQEDELTARIRPYFSAWHSLVSRNDEAAAHLIHADDVHILLDISGHTEYNRLPVFAWKPAPVQVTWLGLPSTTGVAEIDYVLGDPHAIPSEFESHFSETVWRLPDSYLCLTVPESPIPVATLPALSSDRVTFGSFNNLTKIGDGVVAVWARILKSVPDSRLFLKTKQLNDLATRKQTLQRFAACGIAADRLILAGTFASRDDHLAAYNQVDIALDTFPYPGVTTSAEALWMGVPVLSMQGDRFMSCTAGSIAYNAGLPDWIAADQDDYVAKAMAFASDLGRLATLRANLRQQVLASPLFDAPRFARNFEDALWGMWQRYQSQ